MSNPRKQLQALIDGIPGGKTSLVLESHEERLLRSLRTQGERAVRGRLVYRYVFEARQRTNGVVIVMEADGRHAMSVAQHLAKRFGMVEDVVSVEVTRTACGAVLSLLPRGDR